MCTLTTHTCGATAKWDRGVHQNVGQSAVRLGRCRSRCVLCCRARGFRSTCMQWVATTDHLTWTRFSFFGHIASSVSGSIFHCERTAALIDRCTEDLTDVWPEMSIEGLNLTHPSDDQRRSLQIKDDLLLLEHSDGDSRKIDRVPRDGGGGCHK